MDGACTRCVRCRTARNRVDDSFRRCIHLQRRATRIACCRQSDRSGRPGHDVLRVARISAHAHLGFLRDLGAKAMAPTGPTHTSLRSQMRSRKTPRIPEKAASQDPSSTFRALRRGERLEHGWPSAVSTQRSARSALASQAIGRLHRKGSSPRGEHRPRLAAGLASHLVGTFTNQVRESCTSLIGRAMFTSCGRKSFQPLAGCVLLHVRPQIS